MLTGFCPKYSRIMEFAHCSEGSSMQGRFIQATATRTNPVGELMLQPSHRLASAG